MLIKKAYRGEFKHLLSILRLAMLDNRTDVAFSKRKFGYSPILETLRLAGFIESYEERSELVLIRLKQTYWKSMQHPLHSFSIVRGMRLNKKGTASAKQTRKYQLRQGQVASAIFSTDRGVITARTAAANKIGGIPLAELY